MFSILQTSRSQNGFIPLSEIMNVANYFTLIGTLEEFVNIIQALDLAENRYAEKKSSKKKES